MSSFQITRMDCIKCYRCCLCGKELNKVEAERLYICDHSATDLEGVAEQGNLDIVYDYDQIKKKIKGHGGLRPKSAGMWRYKALLPVRYESMEPPISIGGTPLYDAPRLAEVCGVRALYVKDDGRNPTCSLKDRASALLAVKCKDEKKGVITTASTGNAGAALAGICAAMDLPCVIFVPASAPAAKIAQLLVYGASLILVDGTYDDAFDMCRKAAEKYGWYIRNTGYNAHTSEGKKTVSYEICEQLGEKFGKDEETKSFAAPDWLAVSCGDGNILSGVHAGLKDLIAIGWIDHMPKLLGVQAKGSAPVARAWNTYHGDLKAAAQDKSFPGCEAKPYSCNTQADSISAGVPRDRLRAMRAVEKTGGAFVEVTDEEIIAAIPLLARTTGVFAEPAAAASLAGIRVACKEGLIDPASSVVALITGNGLKDIKSAQKSVDDAPSIRPNDMEALSCALRGLDVIQ